MVSGSIKAYQKCYILLYRKCIKHRHALYFLTSKWTGVYQNIQIIFRCMRPGHCNVFRDPMLRRRYQFLSETWPIRALVPWLILTRQNEKLLSRINTWHCLRFCHKWFCQTSQKCQHGVTFVFRKCCWIQWPLEIYFCFWCFIMVDQTWMAFKSNLSWES